MIKDQSKYLIEYIYYQLAVIIMLNISYMIILSFIQYFTDVLIPILLCYTWIIFKFDFIMIFIFLYH